MGDEKLSIKNLSENFKEFDCFEEYDCVRMESKNKSLEVFVYEKDVTMKRP
jgi:hypothetical protein